MIEEVKRIINIAVSAGAGLAGAALFFILALVLHLGGLGEDAGDSTSPTPAPAYFAATPAVSGESLSPNQIYERYADSVVQIVATFNGESTGYRSSSEQQGIGSGFVVSADGYILTNAHVVATEGLQASEQASELEINFRNGKKAKATIVGYDLTSSDIAVLKVDPEDLELVPAVMGDSNNVRVGEPVVAIGSPFGVYASSLTSGIVSATNRTVESPEAGFSIQNAIQTDAAINRGNSGGPLFNSRGEVIGLNEQIASLSGGYEGIGFAVPINTARQAMDQIIATGEVQYAWMGVVGQTLDEESAKKFDLGVTAGALISDLQAGAPAEKAGMKRGDVITAVNGEEVKTMEDVVRIISAFKPGDQIEVTYVRGKEDPQTTEIELAKRPARL